MLKHLKCEILFTTDVLGAIDVVNQSFQQNVEKVHESWISVSQSWAGTLDLSGLAVGSIGAQD